MSDKEQGLGNKIQRGLETQAAIQMIVRLQDVGLPDDIAGKYLAGVYEGKAAEVLETLGQIWPKLIKR